MWPFTRRKRQRRSYAGASMGRLTTDWVSSGTSADSEVKNSLRVLRNRARSLVRDSDFAKSALRAVSNNVVGQGIKHQSQVRMIRGGRLDERLNNVIEHEWRKWSKAKNCHAGGTLSWSDIQRLCLRSMIESGEVFVRFVNQRFGDSRVPFGLEVIEADLLDDDYTGIETNCNRVRMGVEVDKWNRPIAYHFLTVHPGDYQSGGDVWAQRATYQDISGAANMTTVERQKYDAAVRRAEGSSKKATRIMNKIQSGKKTLMTDTELLKFFNNYVKVGRDIPSVKAAYNQFQFHMGREVDKEVQKRQTTASQEKLALKFLGTLEFMEKNEQEFKMLIACYMNIQYCKNILVRQLQKVQVLRIFADMGNKYVAANPEGYVAVKGERAVKLIDRLDFSRLNFTITKQWDK